VVLALAATAKRRPIPLSPFLFWNFLKIRECVFAIKMLQNRVGVLELSQEFLTKKKTGWSRNLDKKVLIAETA
jgi:hypothetical protein